jgi:hypothetical protein
VRTYRTIATATATTIILVYNNAIQFSYLFQCAASTAKWQITDTAQTKTNKYNQNNNQQLIIKITIILHKDKPINKGY